VNKLKKGLFMGLVLLFILALAACGGTSSEEASNPEPASSESSPETEENSEESNEGSEEKVEVKTMSIGYSGPLSGPAAFYGENTLSGLEMAVKEINESGGFEVDGQPYTINLVTLDDKYLPNETGTNARRLLQEHDTPIIFTPHSGGVFAMQVFNEQEEFLIAAYTSEPKVSGQGNTLTLRIPPKYSIYIEPFSKYSMDRFGKKVAMLPTASQYGKDWAEVFKEGWTSLGGEITYEGSVDFSKDTDFFTIVTNALEGDPDVLFIGGPSQPTALVAKQARDLGFEGGFIVMDQAKLDEMAEVVGGYEPLEGSVGVLPLSESNFPGTAAFIEKYQAQYNKMPGSEAGFHYVTTYILVEAMKAAGTVSDPKAIMANIQAGLDNIPEEKQVYSIEKIEEDGGFGGILRMAVIEDGKLKEITEADIK
jgi:branched-chain amino acid transport system substrate-binding protein